MKKRAAICLSGHFRNIAATFYTNFVDNLRKDFDVDIFIHTWRENDCSDTPGIKEIQGLKVVNVHEIDINHILSFYNPTKFTITNYDKVRDLFHYNKFLNNPPAQSSFLHYVINDILIAAPQLYGIKESIKLALQYSYDNNFTYDLIFRVRPDFEFCHPFDVEVTNNLVVPIVYKEKHGEKNDVYALDDRFGYSSQNTMIIYASIFFNLKLLIQSWKSDEFPYNCDENNLQHLSCERILHRAMVKNNTNFKENGIKLVRAAKI